MPDRDRKLDLSADLGDMHADLLKDVAAATEQVKKRQAADRAKEAEQAAKASSRKTSALLVAIGAVLVLLVSYWIVFARQGSPQETVSGGSGSPTASQTQTVNGQIQPPIVTPAPTAPPARIAPPVGRDSQASQRPPEGYEQPGYDPGM